MRVPVVVAAILLACGGSSSDGPSGQTSNGNTPQFLIEIRGMAFSPQQLQVSPGATVTVRNLDSMAHSVTSEAAENDFTPGGVAGVTFDTGVFTGERTFTIPADAAEGTVIPFYCSTHRGSMATPNGSILVTANPQNSTASSGSSGGGGGGTGY